MVDPQLLLQPLAGETPVGGGGGFAVTAVAVFASRFIAQFGDYGRTFVSGFDRYAAAAKMVAEQVEHPVL